MQHDILRNVPQEEDPLPSVTSGCRAGRGGDGPEDGRVRRGEQAAKAADEPDARAMSTLALMTESGKWVRPPDEIAALELYR